MKHGVQSLMQAGEFPLLELNEAVETVCEQLEEAIAVLEDSDRWEATTTTFYLGELFHSLPEMVVLLEKLKKAQAELEGVFTPAMWMRMQIELKAEEAREAALHQPR